MYGSTFPIGSKAFAWVSADTKHAVVEVGLMVLAFGAEKMTEYVVPTLQSAGSSGELAALVLGWGLLQIKRFVGNNQQTPA